VPGAVTVVTLPAAFVSDVTVVPGAVTRVTLPVSLFLASTLVPGAVTCTLAFSSFCTWW
jgi:hypothetical protein